MLLASLAFPIDRLGDIVAGDAPARAAQVARGLEAKLRIFFERPQDQVIQFRAERWTYHGRRQRCAAQDGIEHCAVRGTIEGPHTRGQFISDYSEAEQVASRTRRLSLDLFGRKILN